MKRQRVILTAAVVCDRCGETIKAGGEAVVAFDVRTGVCRFTHGVCPNDGESAAKVRRPTPPKTHVRGAVRVRTSNRRKGKSNNNSRKVR